MNNIRVCGRTFATMSCSIGTSLSPDVTILVCCSFVFEFVLDSLIVALDKDVTRTDRTLDYYADEGGAGLTSLQDILSTYIFLNMDLGNPLHNHLHNVLIASHNSDYMMHNLIIEHRIRTRNE